MLATVIDGFVNHIRNTVTGFDANNCKGYDDESVLDYVLRNDLSPNPQQACIVSYGGIQPSRALSEFGGQIIHWLIIVSDLLPLSGDRVEYQTQIENAYRFIDDVVNSVVANSTLGGTVMDCVIYDGEPLMEYVRNGANTFMLVSLRFVVTENLP